MRQASSLIYSLACWLLILVIPFKTVHGRVLNQNVDSLLKTAGKTFNTDHTKGIALAKQAYAVSLKDDIIPQQIKCLKHIAFFYINSTDFIHAHPYADQALAIAQKSNIDSLIGDSWYLKGYIYHLENNYHTAIKNYQQAIIYYDRLQFEKKLANIYLNLGICESRLSNYGAANNYYFKSADKFINLKDSSALSSTYNSIAICFFSLNNVQKSLAYHHKALLLRMELKNKELIAQSYNNLGYVYKDSQPDSAIFFLTKCLEIRSSEKDSSVLVNTLQNLGYAWKKRGELGKSMNYVLRAIKIARLYKMKEEYSHGELDLAELYIAKGHYSEAVIAIGVAENTAKMLNLPELLMEVYADKYDLYLHQKDYKNALLYANKKNAIQQSINSVAQEKDINELEIKYQSNLKEKNIQTLNLQNKLQSKTVAQQQLSITILIIGAALILLLFVIAYNNVRIKTKANERIQTLLRELHHRVKNNLQTLSALFAMQIETLNDEATKNTLRENETRLAAMNLIHKQLYLDHSSTQIEMRHYLTQLLHHIKESFGGDKKQNIELQIEADEISLEADKAIALGLIVTEIVTNSFKFAFVQNGQIYVGLKQTGKSKIELNLRDNGQGFGKNDKEKNMSFGLRLVNLMAAQLHSKLVMQNDNGVSYQLEIHV